MIYPASEPLLELPYYPSTAVDDFAPLVEQLVVFEPTVLPHTFCTNITIVDDLLVEEDEVFILVLTTDDGGILLSPNDVIVTITDRDGKTFRNGQSH